MKYDVVKAITFSSAGGVWYWHVLYDGDTVGRIAGKGGWQFSWSNGWPHCRPDKVCDAISAAVQEQLVIIKIKEKMLS